MKIREIVKCQSIIKKIMMMNFNTIKKSYEAFKLGQDYEDIMKFIINEQEKLFESIENVEKKEDGTIDIPKDKWKEFSDKYGKFNNLELEFPKRKICLTLDDIFLAIQPTEDIYKINANDFETLELLMDKIFKYNRKVDISGE